MAECGQMVDCDTSKETRGRHLGFTEAMNQMFVTKFSTNIYWHIGIIHSTQQILECHVKQALKVLSMKNEALQMRIRPVHTDQNNPTEFKFERMADPNKTDLEVISIKSKDEWPNVISRDVAVNKIDTINGPLWRVILGQVQKEDNSNSSAHAHEYILLLKIHHGICDGKSVSDLMTRQLLPILSAVANGHDAEHIFSFVPQIRSVEELFLSRQRLENPVPWYLKFAARALRCKRRMFNANEIPVCCFPDETASAAGELHLDAYCVPRVFEKEISESVIKAAKSNTVTVHAVLLVAGAMALSRTAEAAGLKFPDTFRQMWPVDLRKFLDLKTPQPLGNIVALAYTTHRKSSDCSLKAFWQTCGQICSAVKIQSDRRKSTSFLGFVQYFLAEIAEGRFETAVEEMGMYYCISLSNLGSVSVDPDPCKTDGPNKIHMTEQFFTLSRPMTYSPFYQCMVTFRGQFMWNILHHPKKVSRKFVETYYDHLAEILQAYCAQK